MQTLKKRGPIRQFSFQCNSPNTPERKGSLKKHFSEEFVEISSTSGIEKSNGVRVSLRNMKHVETSPKLAWSNVTQNEKKESDRSFSDNKQRTTSMPNRIIKQQSLDKNMIFNPRQADRSTKGEKVQGKQNLNIFLGGNINDAKDEELSDSSYSSVDNKRSNSRRPKLILPLKPEITNNDNMKNVFQKHIRKITKQKSLFIDNCYSPTQNESCSTIVVPVIANKPPHKEPKIHLQSSVDIDTSKRKEQSETKAESSRPSTAATRRQAFQKRASSAISISSTVKEKKENSFRPPLVRTSSVPAGQEPPKPKFITTKRRVKTAKAKIRIGTTDDDDLELNRRNWPKRCVSVSGCEVETMVSLVSPSGSENEEESHEEKEKQKLEEQAAKSPVVKEEPKQINEHRHFSLRKTVKSVSFQQSTIHAIRSFSASFPARRGSVATALFLNHSIVPQMEQTQKIQEKRAPVNAIDDEESVPKRRLIRTKSAPLQRSISDETTNGSTAKENNNPEGDTKTHDEISENDDVTQNNSANNETSPYENSKERQCWDTYCKMSEKGVTISFDTILRGMLTPTEYRLRSKVPSNAPEDNCEIAEN